MRQRIAPCMLQGAPVMERDMRLWVTGTPAGSAAVYHAACAAREVFRRWGLTPEHCQRQARAFEEGDDYGVRGLAAWQEAEREALALCHEGWEKPPDGARLQLLP
jgi:hypothetical protein